MDSNPSQNEELYRAAVGEGKAGYYLPLFYRFDQPGASRVSWNWPAFFVPFSGCSTGACTVWPPVTSSCTRSRS
jgi:hypothetical protein